MGKVAAYIDNKVNYEIWANGKQLERVLVHPNLLVIPEKGSLLSFGQDDSTNPLVRCNRETILRVTDVQFKQSVVRRLQGSQESDGVDAQMKQSVIVIAEVVQSLSWAGVHVPGPVVSVTTAVSQ